MIKMQAVWMDVVGDDVDRWCDSHPIVATYIYGHPRAYSYGTRALPQRSLSSSTLGALFEPFSLRGLFESSCAFSALPA